jgi:hypothetical protein
VDGAIFASGLASCRGAFFVVVPALLRATVFNGCTKTWGDPLQHHGAAALFMALMPIKMVLRWLFNLKYFIYFPEFNANL